MAQESVLRITIDSRNAERNARALANELGSIEKKGDFASKSMDSMSVATRQLAGYMAGVVTVGAAISKMDAYTGMQNRLNLVTESQEQLNLAMSDTFNIAQKSYQSWDSVIQVYQRFSDNAKTLGINMTKTAELTETVSKAVAISGASTQAAEAALTQFGQALASGVLRGEELNSILEQTPALAKAIAQGMGITVGQLRSVAAEGKITGDVLVNALTKSKQSVDELFAKTDITIGQSIQLLSNEVTKFTGEAGKASGVATTLASSIQILANNLDAIAGIAVVGGVALLTKTIAAQTVAIHGSISAAVAKRAADAAALQSQVQLAAVEVQRTRQVTALALTEINLARQELNGATTRQARAAATMRLTQAEIAHSIALKQSAAAVATQTAAENALNVSRSRSAMLLGMVGGWTGVLTIGVTALAAGYMYFSNKAAEANAKLEEQGKVANKTKEELLALRGVQLDVAKDDLKASFEAQNEALHKANIAFNGFIATIAKSKQSSAEAKEIYDQVRQGLISQEEAIERLNRLDLLTPAQKAQGLDFLNIYEEARRKAQENADAQKVLKIDVDLAGNAMQNAAGKARDKASAMGDDANATRDAAQANRDYTASLQQRAWDQKFLTSLVTKHNKTQQEANLLLEAYKKTNGNISKEDKAHIATIVAEQKALENYGKVQSATSKARTSAAKSENKAAKEAERLQIEQYQLREQIAYEYTDRIGKIEKDLAREIAEIQKANFANPEHTAGYIEAAQGRAMLEKELYIAQLRQQYSEWRATEEEKLDFRVHINELMIQLDSNMTEEMRSDAMRSLKDQANYELAQIKLAKETRIFQANQAIYSEMELIQKRYELERRKIMEIQDMEERSALLAGSYINQAQDESALKDNTLSAYSNIMGYEESPLVKQFEVLQKMRELDLLNEEAYQNAKLQLQAKSTAGYMEGMLGGFASLVDENSKTYAVLFAAQKAFAVAQAMLNIPAAYSKAYDAVVGTPYVGPYIAPAVGAAAAALQVAQAASIKSTNMSGFKSGGYTGNYGTNQVAGVVHGQEYVLNAEATKRVGVNTLNAINNGSTIQAEKQAQANAKASSGKPQTIDNNLRVIMVKDENEAKDWLYGPEGEKAFLYHMKRNRSKF
ncbi:tape measure protein [Acinetobacter towneri]|uniref:tape measure protein n=1 Tax=Acinetobacter towneri TaxID=202956 RepID=UPI002934762F|nr:tape measure protein [Acinetobacter towneri]WOE29748.1 tape measure protein [Acinetobacter towneri]